VGSNRSKNYQSKLYITANFQFIVGGGVNKNPQLTLTIATTQFFGYVVYNTNVGVGIASLAFPTNGDATSGIYASIFKH